MDDSPERILGLLHAQNPQEYDDNGVKTPESALMSSLPDGPDDHIARAVHGNYVKRALTELRATKKQTFRGVKGTVDIVFAEESDDGSIEEFVVPFKIRSIPEHALKKELKAFQEIASAVPQRTNPETGAKEPDYDDPEFVAAAQNFAEAQEHLSYTKLLLGLDMAVYDENDAPVWQPGARGAKDRDETIRVLTEVYEITAADIKRIVDAIESLTSEAAEQEEEAFEKN